VGDLNSEASVAIMQFMDLTALTCPVRITGDLYISSGLLNKVLGVILAKRETNVVLTQYLGFLARIALDDAGYLANAITAAGQQSGQPQLLGTLVDFWMEKVCCPLTPYSFACGELHNKTRTLAADVLSLLSSLV